MKKKLAKKIAVVTMGATLIFSSFGFKSDFFEIAKQIEIFTTLFKEINMNYVEETNPAALMDTAIKAMLADLDPYTNYWNEQDVEAARINNSGEYSGIGATVQVIEDALLIMEPYRGYPADEAGLKAGDEIIEIEGIKVADYTDDVGELLNGSPDSQINIKYRRQGEIKSTELTRSAINLKAVPFYELLDEKTGYIVLSRFNAKASSETIRALKDLKNQGAEEIILDLRGNPGGLLTEAINVSNIFLPKGELITTTKSVIEKYNKAYQTQKEPIDTQIPLVVLVNGRSASASEIVAGAIQDLDRGVVVGARSFGKGLVQRPKELAYGTQLKITISRYYTPSGRCIQALNYAERDEEGKAIKRAVEDYNEFKTRNGRSVFDGGGISPDVKLETSEYSNITNALLAQNAIFNFATEYYYKNDLKDPESFEFTDADFNNFKSFLKTSNFDYKTATEQELEELLAIASKEGYEQDILGHYKSISTEIEAQKKKELDEKKHEIVSILTDEIIKRYFYKEGLYEYYVDHNPEILEAKSILNNNQRYSEILQ
ncbi:carboxyl-terminal processing protease [Salegentibacter agarivorans]|jgi:carboxyl-terminal processing protease|uniref:Carboxyl-terminal processing protease n=2 Tax=Salegentibacter TaxID=143222 RepID=A0A1I2MGK4_9FLAO|nr:MULTISPECIES: S41 family peptidase [Salegentibacter]APS38128.1 peptidase S41 [Salegentibacter sp. T436]SFF90108.1 carboxyl-terminal processing protease [Salegentibacter agarivorans]